MIGVLVAIETEVMDMKRTGISSSISTTNIQITGRNRIIIETRTLDRKVLVESLYELFVLGAEGGRSKSNALLVRYVVVAVAVYQQANQ